MIHEPAKWAGWQSTTAAAQHLDRLKQMQSQIYRILAEGSGKPLRQIIRDTKALCGMPVATAAPKRCVTFSGLR